MSFVVPCACLALLAAFLAAVVYPVLAPPLAWRRQTGSARRRLELTERKEQLYASIKELEFDHRVGKMSQDDHDSLREELESRALGVLSRLHRLEARDPDIDLRKRIEVDVRDLAARKPGSGVDSPTAQPSSACDPCLGCGRTREPGHRFCPGCGQRLDEPSTPP